MPKISFTTMSIKFINQVQLACYIRNPNNNTRALTEISAYYKMHINITQ